MPVYICCIKDFRRTLQLFGRQGERSDVFPSSTRKHLLTQLPKVRPRLFGSLRLQDAAVPAAALQPWHSCIILKRRTTHSSRRWSGRGNKCVTRMKLPHVEKLSISGGGRRPTGPSKPVKAPAVTPCCSLWCFLFSILMSFYRVCVCVWCSASWLRSSWVITSIIISLSQPLLLLSSSWTKARLLSPTTSLFPECHSDTNASHNSLSNIEQ